MLSLIKPFAALYTAVFLEMAGLGLLGTYLSLRLTVEGFSAQTTGFVLTTYYAGLVTGALISIRLIRSFGHIRAYAAFASITMAVIMLHGLYISAPFWALLRFVSGIANMGLFTVIESWFNGCTPPGSRGKVFSFYMIMTYLGTCLGQQFLTLGQIQDNTLFFVVGFFLVCSIIPVSVTRSINPELPETEPIRFSKIIKTAPIGIMGCFVSGLLTSSFYTMGPVFCHTIHLSVSQVSWFMTLTIMGGLILQWPIGVFSDRFDRSIVLPVLGLIVAVAASLMFFAARQPFPVLIVATTLFGGFLFTIYPVSVARAHDMFDPQDVVNVSTSLLISFGIGAALGPLTAATIMEASSSPYGFYAFFCCVGAVFTVMALGLRKMEFVDIIPVEDQVDFVMMQRTSPVAMHLDPRSAVDSDDREAAPAG